MKAILIPGNGRGSPQDNWFPWLEIELPKLGIEVINVQFPDPELARKEFWLPFITKLGADESTILIGHSSGGLAAIRYAETNQILGSILVGVCHTDLGYDSERQSGYYDGPWNWNATKKNQKWIIQFASTDDPFIPIEEARFIHQNLGSDYHEYTDQGHFGHGDYPKIEFPELIDALKTKINL